MLWSLGSSSLSKASKALADSLLLVMKPVLSVLSFKPSEARFVCSVRKARAASLAA